MTHLAIVTDVHLLPEAEQQLTELVGATLTFPHEDGRPDTSTLIARTGDADAILVSTGTPLTAEYFAACPALRYIGICGTSRADIDLDAAAASAVTITNVVDYGDEPAAEFIVMQLARLFRGMGEYQWQSEPRELMGKTIGIIGLGALGSAVAKLASAYGMNVISSSRTPKPAMEALGVRPTTKAQLLASSQVVIITTPTNLVAIERDDFDLLRPNTVLVQASLGRCVDPDGFTAWIAQDGNFALFDYSAGQASFDAYADLPRVIFPTAVAGYTYEARQRLGDAVVANLRGYLQQESTPAV